MCGMLIIRHVRAAAPLLAFSRTRTRLSRFRPLDDHTRRALGMSKCSEPRSKRSVSRIIEPNECTLRINRARADAALQTFGMKLDTLAKRDKHSIVRALVRPIEGAQPTDGTAHRIVLLVCLLLLDLCWTLG